VHLKKTTAVILNQDIYVTSCICKTIEKFSIFHNKWTTVDFAIPKRAERILFISKGQLWILQSNKEFPESVVTISETNKNTAKIISSSDDYYSTTWTATGAYVYGNAIITVNDG